MKNQTPRDERVKVLNAMTDGALYHRANQLLAINQYSTYNREELILRILRTEQKLGLVGH